jgi:outer membrane protein TolC
MVITAPAALFLSACSPGDYKDWSDMQVYSMLADRTKQTIDYTPKTSLDDFDGPTTRPVIANIYKKVPFSPKSSDAQTPLEIEKVEYSFEPLGPENYLINPPADEGKWAGIDKIEDRLSALEIHGPLGPSLPVLRLDLFGCIAYAANHSRAYQDQLDNLYLSAIDVTTQRHLFDPTPSMTSSVTYNGNGGDTSDYASAMRAVNTLQLAQKLPLGGTVTAQATHTLVETISGQATDGQSAQLALKGSIPLLKGAGMVNLEGLISSERSLVYQIRTFENYRRSFVVSISSQFFNLLTSAQSVQNRRLNLRNLDSLTERTRALYDAGRISFLEVQRAMQSQLTAVSSLLSAEESYVAALDDFKVLVGMPVEQPFDIVLVQLQVNIPRVDEKNALGEALRFRLDLQTARDQLEDAHRGVKNAENGLLPELNLDAGASTGDTAPGEIHFGPDVASYSAGLTMNIPLDQLTQRNNYRKALIKVDQANRSLNQLNDQIISDVRQAIRSIQLAETNYQIQLRGIALAEKRLDYSNELLRQGKTNARDIVESQQSLLDSQDQASRAYNQLQTRVLEYMQYTGTLRVDPNAGSIGKAMERGKADADALKESAVNE